MDYMYTTFHQAHNDGTPVLNPLWYKYPQDPATFPIDLQFLYGDSILVSPVTEENATSVTIYLPKDIFYEFDTLAPVQGQGANVTLTNVNLTQIPVHIRGGAVLPLRARGAMTTTALRETDFEFIVAPGTDGCASGSLYMDDGVSITPASSTEVTMSYSKGKLEVQGSFGFKTGVKVAGVKFLGVSSAPQSVEVNGKQVSAKEQTYDSDTKVLDVTIGSPFVSAFSVQFS